MSRRPAKHWPLRRRAIERPSVDLNAPGSDGYAARHRVFETVLPDGTLKIDIGAPQSSIDGEPEARLRAAPAAQPEPAGSAPEAAPAIAPLSIAPPKEPDLKPALGKRT